MPMVIWTRNLKPRHHVHEDALPPRSVGHLLDLPGLPFAFLQDRRYSRQLEILEVFEDAQTMVPHGLHDLR